MSAATVEDAIVDHWASYGTLDTYIDGERVYIGDVPLLDEVTLDEVTPPYGSVREESVVRTIRTNETARFVEAIVSIEVAHEQRELARAISDAVHARFNRRELTYANGSVSDMRPQVRRERQGADGLWLVAWLFLVRYSVTT